jgi:LuxR family maltose regulon positive regulatory protein
LGSQPETVQSFLLDTSILDRLSESLCNVVTGRNDSQAILERLEQANLFLSALDAQRQWYRYHHLFADLLRNRLQRSAPQRLPELHRRASQWHQENGQIEQALLHANAIPDYALSSAVIEQAAGALKMISGWGQILYWIQSIPGQAIDLHPNLALLKAWGLVLTDQANEVDALLDSVEQGAQRHTELAAAGKWRGQALVIRARLAYLQGRFEDAVELSHRAAEIVDAGDLTRQYFLWMTLGLSYVAAGNLAQASRALEEAWRCSARMGSPAAELEAIGTLAEVQEILGKLRQAAATYRRILQLSGERIDLSVLSAHYHLGSVLYAWYQLDEAQQHLEICLSQARLMHHAEAGLLASLWLARIALARGETERAAELVHKIEAEALLKPETIASPYITGSLMLLKQSLGGEAGKAGVDLEKFSLPQDLQHSSFLYHKPQYQAEARRLVASNRAAQAERYLELLLPIAEGSGDALGVIELLALKALGLQQRGNSSGALVALAQALQRAEPEGYAAAFLELGAPMVALLRQARAGQILPEFVSRLLALVEEHGSLRLQAPALIESLSLREQEILRLMAAGKSNQEIAAELVLAVGTVKKHLSNIFGKLGVQSRTQCALRAQELRLV